MPSEGFIKALVIFDKKTELPIINYFPAEDFEMEPPIIIGFLSSIMKFVKKIGQLDLKIVDIENYRFIFTEKQDIIFLLITTKLMNPLDLLFKLNTVITLFLNEFPEEKLANVKKHEKEFEDFKEIMRQVVYGEVTALDVSKQEQIKSILDNFNEREMLVGSGILSFTGKMLINAFYNSEIDLIDAIFNSIFEIKISGITKVFIEFQNKKFISTKINDQTVLVAISKIGKGYAKLEEEIEKVKTEIIEVLK